MTRTFISVVIVAITISSCYYPAQVVLHNKSGADKNIRVVYPANYKAGFVNDSLTGYDHTLTEDAFSSRDYHRYGVNIPVENPETINRTYTFLLKDKHQVIVETGWPVSSLPWGETFIIDNADTLILRKKSKPFKKKGGSWEFTLTADKE